MVDKNNGDLDLSGLSKEDIVKIAEEAYVFGLPYVLEYRTMYRQAIDKSSKSYVGFGNFLHYGAATADDKDVMTPNRDTPYSWFWVDLRAEPWVLTIPKMDSTNHRYYTFQINDLAGFVLDNPSALEDGYDGGNYLMVPPNWSGDVPESITRVIEGETYFLGAIGRIELFDDDDIKNIRKIQESCELNPLSKFLNKSETKKVPSTDFYPFEDGITDITINFFDCLSFVLQFSEPNEIDKEILDKMAKIGIVPGNDWLKLAKENNILKEGAEEGLKNKIEFFKELSKKPISAGNITAFDNRNIMKDDYLSRAIGAYLGLFGNTKKQAIYSNIGLDSDNNPLDGVNNYTMTFSGDDLPDVKFFWSLTMYKMKDRFLVHNPIDRYAIGSRTKDLKYDKDNSLVIYLQNENPGKDKENNWLPSPKEPFYMILRYYGPGKNIRDGSWKQPDVIKSN